MATLTEHLPISWGHIRSRLIHSLVIRNARAAAGKFMKQDVPIFGSVSWLPVAHLDGDPRAREVFDQEACKRAETFGEYIETKYEVGSTEARCLFLQAAEDRWEDVVTSVLDERRQAHTSQLANFLF